jgi:type IV pilus assembly protein PilW
MNQLSSRRRGAQRQTGFTMIELMVALLIGLFLMGGLMTLLQNNRKAFSSQSQLGQLQDSERLAMSMMTGVIQQSGYFTDPTINSPSTALPASGSFAAGQGLTGTTADTISARYTTAPGDGILNCHGTSNPAASGANATYVNTFSVSGGQLVCTDETATIYPLVSGVTNLAVLYGVSTSAIGGNVDTYMTAAQVTAASAWNNVISVSVSLTFTNPLYVSTNVQGQPPTIAVQRYIAIMRQT